MKPLSRLATVVALLDTYQDAQETLQSGIKTGERRDSRELQMPNLWKEGSYAELERCLRLMRALGKQQAIPYGNGKIPLGTVYWHVSQWWLDCQRRTTLACPNCRPQDRKRFDYLPHDHKGKVNKPVPVRDTIRHPDADEGKALAGAGWLADKMRGAVRLPGPFLANLTGYDPPDRRAA